MSGSRDASGSGCFGCLGLLAFLALIGGFLFGGGISLRIGQWTFFMGNPTYPNQLVDTNQALDADQVITGYFKALGDTAKIVNASARKLRTQFNQDKYQEIYEQASDEFKRDLKQSEFITLCIQVKNQIGSLESAELMDWWGQPAVQGGSYLLVRYQTQSSKSPVLETFVWYVSDGNPKLVNYQVTPAQASPLPNPQLPSQI